METTKKVALMKPIVGSAAKFRRSGVPSLIESLTTDQRNALRKWLFVDGLTYKTVTARLKSQFNFVVSAGVIHRFWQKETAKQMQSQKVSTPANSQIQPEAELLIEIHEPSAVAVTVRKCGNIRIRVQPLPKK